MPRAIDRAHRNLLRRIARTRDRTIALISAYTRVRTCNDNSWTHIPRPARSFQLELDVTRVRARIKTPVNATEAMKVGCCYSETIKRNQISGKENFRTLFAM